MSRTALITGSAGFIGYFTAQALLAHGWQVVGLDAMTDYYDVSLKQKRRAMLRQSPGYDDIEARLETPDVLKNLFEQHRFDIVIHLAAQAGVRHSIDAPRSYVQANLIGTFELLEAARACPPSHMLLASTSSALWGEPRDALWRNRQIRSSDVILCRHKKGEREHGTQLCASVPAAHYDVSFLYCLWALGQAGHGSFQIHQSHPER